jgi:ribosome-associated toxin RatA of RatAB toxin-antitoxin module
VRPTRRHTQCKQCTPPTSARRPGAHRWSPDQLYEVVSRVEDYSQFVPWCVGSTVLRSRPDGGYLEAELEVGFQVFMER